MKHQSGATTAQKLGAFLFLLIVVIIVAYTFMAYLDPHLIEGFTDVLPENFALYGLGIEGGLFVLGCGGAGVNRYRNSGDQDTRR